MTDKTTEKMTRIKLPELASIDNAVREVAKLAGKDGIVLTDKEIKAIIASAKTLDYNNYLVKGDFNSIGQEGTDNLKFLNEILGDTTNSDKYCLYTVQIARMIKQAAINTSVDSKINNALKDFVTTYNREKISNNMNGFKMYEEFATARNPAEKSQTKMRLWL